MTISADADTAQSRHVPLSRLREPPSSTVETQQKAGDRARLEPRRDWRADMHWRGRELSTAFGTGRLDGQRQAPTFSPMGFLTTCVLTDYIRLHRTNQSSAPAHRVRNIAKATVDTKVRTACRRPQRVSRRPASTSCAFNAGSSNRV